MRKKKIQGDEPLAVTLRDTPQGCAWQIVVDKSIAETAPSGIEISVNEAMRAAHEAAGQLGFSPEHPIDYRVIFSAEDTRSDNNDR